MDVDLNRWDDECAAWLVAEVDGYDVHICPMLFGNQRVVLTPKGQKDVYDAGWCYRDMLRAVAALRVWDYETVAEPAGYVKWVGLTEDWVLARVLTARTGVAAEPPTASDVAVLMGEENAEAGEHWNIRPEPRPEAVPGTRQVVEAE